ncbi:unnamed protein product [Ambrosiozyma monospora]|uniref:Unnamed protein product n=1 Tax=Ambrosiozyma monospora TaxID=43982 RepID=A0A9W6YZK6_AMBMO|nr:unnamed protein product [Ambrosiozyma monospora]
MSSGSFQRVFRLPKSVDGELINAQFENGVLSLSVPKVEEEKKTNLHRINIGSSTNDDTGATSNEKEPNGANADTDTEMKN